MQELTKLDHKYQLAMPEPPEIRLVFKTDDSENLEQTTTQRAEVPWQAHRGCVWTEIGL